MSETTTCAPMPQPPERDGWRVTKEISLPGVVALLVNVGVLAFMLGVMRSDVVHNREGIMRAEKNLAKHDARQAHSAIDHRVGVIEVWKDRVTSQGPRPFGPWPVE